MKRVWQITNILSLCFALAANYLTSTQALGLPAIKDISDTYANPLTPATYAFSIWSVIYLALIVFVVYQARDLFKPQVSNRLPGRIGPLFTIASICNGLWTYVFLNELIGLSVIILITLTTSLYILLWRLRIAIYDASSAVIFCVWWPLLLYAGWVTAASLANIGNWLTAMDIRIPAAAASLAIVVLGAALINLLAFRNVRELVLASAWGIVAIGVQQLQNQTSEVVGYTAFAVAGILVIAVLVHGYLNRASSPFWRGR